MQSNALGKTTSAPDMAGNIGQEMGTTPLTGVEEDKAEQQAD